MLSSYPREFFSKLFWLSCITLVILPGTQCGSGKRGPHHPRGCTHKTDGKHDHNHVNENNVIHNQKEHDEA